MEKRTVALLFFIFIFSVSVEAQLEKGKSSFEVVYNNSVVEYSGQTWDLVQLLVRYDRMITNKMMLGATFLFEEEPYTYSRMSFIPEIRYFFTTEKQAAYAFIAPKVVFERPHFSSDPDLQKITVLPEVGLGVNYFINSNIALDAKLGVEFWKDYQKRISKMVFNVGTKVFLSPTEDSSNSQLAESILQKGNWSFTGNLSFKKQYFYDFYSWGRGPISVENKRTDFYFNSGVQYFITNKLQMGAFYRHYKAGRGDHKVSFGVSGAYYMKVFPKLYIKPVFGIEKNIKALAFFQLKTWTIPISVSAEYFSKNKKYFIGTSYSFESNDWLVNAFDLFAGVECFITKDLAVKGVLNYRRAKMSDGDTYYARAFFQNQRLYFSFGLDFWIL